LILELRRGKELGKKVSALPLHPQTQVSCIEQAGGGGARERTILSATLAENGGRLLPTVTCGCKENEFVYSILEAHDLGGLKLHSSRMKIEENRKSIENQHPKDHVHMKKQVALRAEISLKDGACKRIHA